MSTSGPALPAGDTVPANEGQPSTEDIGRLVTMILDAPSAADSSSGICDSFSQSFMDHISVFKEMVQEIQGNFDNPTAEEKEGHDVGAVQDRLTQFMLAIHWLEQSQDRLAKCKMAVISAVTVARQRHQLELMQMVSGNNFEQSEVSMEIKVRNAENFELKYAYRNMKAAIEGAAQDRVLCFAILSAGASVQRPANLNPNIFLDVKRNRRRSF